MPEFINALNFYTDTFFGAVSGWLWGWPLIVILMGTHIYMTVRLGFVQRHLGKMIRLTLSSEKSAQGEISHWGALATALAATVGTGNIVGVATAISLGGPGAVFWMWLTGVFGMATKYAEAVLSVKYRTLNAQGQVVGGPMYVLERGVKCKWLGMLFASFAALAALGIGNMNQASAITENLSQNYAWPREIIALSLMILTGIVILGGVKFIARVCQFLVPLMVVFYFAACLVALVIFVDRIPGAIVTILTEAFRFDAAGGAVVGIGISQAMRYGIARGLFSNESGMGSAPIVAAAAKTSHPVRQGLVSASGTFWDTVVICLMTGLVIVCSGDWMTTNELGERLNGTALTSAAFGVLGDWSAAFLSFTLFTFVFSTILGWAYIGEKSAEYLLGSGVNLIYRLLWIAAVGAGGLLPLDTLFNVSDTLNALMVLPNVFSVLVLSKIVAQETADYLKKTDVRSES